jgi:dedicator of cytokinesis protein 3
MLDIQGRESTAARLGLIISFAQSVVDGEAYPENWMTINLVSLSGVIKVMRAVGDLLQKPEFLPASSINGATDEDDVTDVDATSLAEPKTMFDVELWRRILVLLCDYCASSQLALEDHTTQRRRAGWIIVGDLRDECATLLIKLWTSLPTNASLAAHFTSVAKLTCRTKASCLTSPIASSASVCQVMISSATLRSRYCFR